MTPRVDAGAAGSAPAGWRIVLALALVGAALGFGWGIADRPLYRATATVVVESDSQGADQARLERFAERGESEQVATRAAGILGDDVPGADLLADVTVRPSPQGGFVTVSATAEAPDVAAAAADGFARALVAVEGDPLALGKAAAIPASPYEDRPAGLWAGIGFLAGLIVGLVAVAVLRLSRRRSGADVDPGAGASSPPPRPSPDSAEPTATPRPVPARGEDPVPGFADRVGAAIVGFDPGPAGAVVPGETGGIAISRPAAPDVGMLADRIGLRSGHGPPTLAVTAVGDAHGPPDSAGLAAALATAAAGAGRRVLLVDADLGSAELSDRLALAPDPGLRDYLDGRAAPRDVLRSVTSGGGTGFACVPAGGRSGDAGITGPRFAALVDRLSRVYELVLYVAPPILGSEDTDTLVELVDGVVVLVGPGAGADDLDQVAGLLEGVTVSAVAASSR